MCCLCLQKGFPLNASLDVLIAYFEKIAPVDTVYMRRDQDKKFKVNEWDYICRSLSTCGSNMHLFYWYFLCLNRYLCNKQIQPWIYISILKIMSFNDVNVKKYYKELGLLRRSKMQWFKFAFDFNEKRLMMLFLLYLRDLYSSHLQKKKMLKSSWQNQRQSMKMLCWLKSQSKLLLSSFRF